MYHVSAQGVDERMIIIIIAVNEKKRRKKELLLSMCHSGGDGVYGYGLL